MEVSKVSPVVAQANTKVQSPADEKTSEIKEKKNGKKLIALGAAALAAAAIAGIAIAKGKGKNAVEAIDDIVTTNLKDINFDKGIARKGDDLFTGIIEHVDKNGNKFLIEYKDGKLVKSMKNCSKDGFNVVDNFVKNYTHDGSGKLLKVEKITKGIDGGEFSEATEFLNTKLLNKKLKKFTGYDNFKIDKAILKTKGGKPMRVTGAAKGIDTKGNPVSMVGTVTKDGEIMMKATKNGVTEFLIDDWFGCEEDVAKGFDQWVNLAKLGQVKKIY